MSYATFTTTSFFQSFLFLSLRIIFPPIVLSWKKQAHLGLLCFSIQFKNFFHHASTFFLHHSSSTHPSFRWCSFKIFIIVSNLQIGQYYVDILKTIMLLHATRYSQSSCILLEVSAEEFESWLHPLSLHWYSLNLNTHTCIDTSSFTRKPYTWFITWMWFFRHLTSTFSLKYATEQSCNHHLEPSKI